MKFLENQLLILSKENEALKLELNNLKHQKWRTDKSVLDLKGTFSYSKQSDDKVIKKCNEEIDNLLVKLE